MRGQSDVKDPCLHFPCLKLLVPPLRLVSAAIWQTIQQKVVADYGMVDEFITMVTELIPELLSDNQRAQLLFGLQARLILERCHSEPMADLQEIQPHLDRIETLVQVFGEEATNMEQGFSRSQFQCLIQTLLSDPDERQHFFQDVFPVVFGPKYDKAIHALTWQFLSRLEELLQVPKLQEVTSLLSDVPSVLEECMASVCHPEVLKSLLEYQKDLLQLEDTGTHCKDSNSSDDLILSALFRSPMERTVVVRGESETHKNPFCGHLKERSATVKDNSDHGSEKDGTHQSRKDDYGNGACLVHTDVTVRNMKGNISETMAYIKDIELAPPEKLSIVLPSTPPFNEEMRSSISKSEDAGEKTEILKTALDVSTEPFRKLGNETDFSEKSNGHGTQKSPLENQEASDITDAPTLFLSRSERPNRGLKMKTFLARERKTSRVQPLEKGSFHLLNHSSGEHRPATSEQQQYKCPNCGRCFQSHLNLKRHIHSFCKRLVQEFPCTVCGKAFPRAAQLKCHMISHSSECPFACSNCERTFKHTSSMKAHEEACLFASQQRWETPVEGHSGTAVLEHNDSKPLNVLSQQAPPGKITELSDNGRRALLLEQISTKGSLSCYHNTTESHQGDNLRVQRCDREATEPLSTTSPNLSRLNEVTEELEHKAVASVSSYACSGCDKVIQSSEEMLQHVTTCSNALNYKCPHCQKPYKYLKNFQKHSMSCKKTHENNSENVQETASESNVKVSNEGGENGNVLESENSESSGSKICPQQLSQTASSTESHRLISTDNVVHTDCDLQVSSVSCPVYSSTLRTRNDLKHHITQSSKVHSVNPKHSVKRGRRKSHRCDECRKEFGLRSTLKAHKLTHNPLYCADCRRVCPDAETLAAHSAVHKPVQCTMCDKSFNVIRFLIKHYLDAHQFKGPFICTYCDKGYSELGALIRHERTHTGDLPFHCTKCPKRFNRHIDLISHERKHTGEKPFLCWVCGKAFSSKEIMKTHMERHSGQEKSFRCPQCTRTFWAKKAVDAHVQIHHKGMRFPCSCCGKLFLSRSALGRHSLIHTGEKPFECVYEQCGKSFRSSAELKIHTRYHTGERPFKCSVCEKGFVQAHYLTIHLRTHTQEKPYACPSCDRCFTTGHQLNRHKLIHSGEKPFKCEDCGEGFSRKHRLRAHREKHHK